MGKRQLIYSASELASELVGKEVNLLTRQRRVWHGHIISVSQSEVVLKDDRSGKHRFQVGDIDKVYQDVVTRY
ncbi:hypothetical protein [Prosthecochloris sp. HL-130-GSB]|jgi:ribosome maturation factor RimP|uniref:hypothetical protein n=1 Tax=Prosthecochloris sp. HL-130-GSB TaxID=1974213 RepID=UPI000A1C11DD|nr:hypothetical protein [Prosthecochloris sp. HL-130-GSB]ARM30627.1 hypothetical protein B9H02_03910 [Prosthecochloris sp. HL-130-GSB]MBO8093211.1 hypothetical protein [Prosthecochloris sp.]